MSDYDVAVVGPTAGGVMAAVAAAEHGASVILLGPQRHVGGMVTGGLGKTDMERQEHVIGGRARRFFERVGERYGQPIAWRFEPHVAEAVLVEWLERARVDVRLGADLHEVRRDRAAIRSVTTASGAEVRAGVWVDATYEGDLLAAAGVTHAVGREARTLHGESLAGRRELLPDPHQFRAPVVAADAGAIARYVRRLDDIGLPGDGDGLTQSFCYRICLSTAATAQRPVPPPDGYDPGTYAAVAAYLRALGDRAWMGDVLGVGEIPGGKTDLNSGGPISTNLLGASRGYIGATPEGRERIALEHRRWAQGLLHFLSTDRDVPASIRDALHRFGLPRDEFRDTDGWPYQLYVREARRMQGELVLTERHLTTERTKPDAIGMGGYNIDIREVQWVAAPVSRFPDVFHELQVEGYLSVPVEPWQIPYRALLPRREECTNLLVPVCLSTSHVAFNGFRLEPQYMIAGEAAGVAAAMAAASRGTVHDLDVEALQGRLLGDGAILSCR